ncbi:MAG: class I SAM-dependent methyltransferase [bacterium]|nr:class I SAM-dependent methyltransferase [bacterium]
MSFFTFHRVAEGYSHSRPQYHQIIMNKIREHVNLHGKFNNALDVGCGTGLSTSALTEIATQITGTDRSAEMIAVAQAQHHENVTYSHAPAEHLPFHQQSFDLIAVCGAINWIDRSRFFPEAQRVLKEQGWLIIYDNFITEHMREYAAYERWYQDEYLQRYPKPPRDETPVTQEECGIHGFQLSKAENYTNELTWSLEEYIDFLVTQSNIIVAVDMEKESLEDVKTWMHTTLAPIIPTKKGSFLFRGYIWYLQRC